MMIQLFDSNQMGAANARRCVCVREQPQPTSHKLRSASVGSSRCCGVISDGSDRNKHHLLGRCSATTGMWGRPTARSEIWSRMEQYVVDRWRRKGRESSPAVGSSAFGKLLSL